VPLLARTDDRIENDSERDQELESGSLEFEVRGHERGQAQADGEAAENEVEDMPASVSLREVGREPIGPTVGFFENVDACREIVRLGAAHAIAAPFIANLGCSMLGGEISRSERLHSGSGQQQGIFDARPDLPQSFAQEALEETLLKLVRWRHQQPAKQDVDIGTVKRARDFGIVGNSHDRGIESTPQDPRVAAGRQRHMDDRRASCQSKLHDFSGSAAASRR
jgi:hypothetical protein